MAAGELHEGRAPERGGVGFGTLVVVLIIFIVAMVGVAASPVIIGTLYVHNGDYSMIGDIGQAFGAASAMLALVALFVVGASVAMQHRQFRAAQLQALAESNKLLVLLAMENPGYRQCWGARVSPDGVDEALFYYCSFVIKQWADAWDRRTMDERQAREYLQSFFDSEVPRLYWERHGNWHRMGEMRDRRARFRGIADEEYLRALKGGPPSRARELWPPPAAGMPSVNDARGRGASPAAAARRGRVR